MGEWYRVLKEVRPGATYLYLQKSERVPGQKWPKTTSRSQGRWNGGPLPKDNDPPPLMVGSVDVGAVLQKAEDLVKVVRKARRKGIVRSIAVGLVGDRDDYDRPIKSVLNRARERRAKEEKGKAAASAAPSTKGAVGGKGESTVAKATDSQSAFGPSEKTGPTTEEG